MALKKPAHDNELHVVQNTRDMAAKLGQCIDVMLVDQCVPVVVPQ